MKNLIHRSRVGFALLGVLFLTSLALAPQAQAVDPCCEIAAINAKTGLVTGRDTATGKTFEFKTNDKKLLQSLRVGQQVAADFGTRKVSVSGVVPCCEIVSGAGAATRPVKPFDPSNGATGTVKPFDPTNGLR